MSQLTKEDFKQAIKDLVTVDVLDKKLSNLVTTDVLDRKFDVLDKKIEKTTSEIIQRIDESQEELARMVVEGFTDIQKRLDVKDRLEKHEKAIQLLA